VKFENPELPEGVNNSERRPFASFVVLAGAALALLAAAAGILLLVAERVAPQVPFAYEKAAAEPFFRDLVAEGPVEPYLKALGARLARAQGLPDGLTIEVHYAEGPVENAFATLGGHIVLHQGLLKAVPSENALAMVLAHEIAHVRHRHPIASLGRAAAFGVVLALAGASNAGSQLLQAAMAQGGTLTMLSFSRAQESEADAAALRAVHALYGHVGHADAFFRVMLAQGRRAEPPQFLASHPLTAARIDALAALAARNGWAADGPATPLPPEVRAALERPRPDGTARKASRAGR
jgi:predicted Zn-dependent protease